MRALRSALLAVVSRGTATGAAGCECATTDDYDFSTVEGVDPCAAGELKTNHLLKPDYSPLCLKTAGYGLGGCAKWDETEVTCTGTNPPSWCGQAWCFVRPGRCTKKSFESFYFPEDVQNERGQGVIYSYETCGVDETTFQRWAASANLNAAELAGVIEGYTSRIGRKIEQAIYDLLSEESQMSERSCEYTDSCDCTNCRVQNGWGADSKVDFGDVSVTHPRHLALAKNSEEARAGQCLADVVEYEFLRIKNREYTDPSRTAYIMYGNQRDGMFFEWPAITWCPDPMTSPYDPRLRNWYVQTVTGPKSIVLIVDRSTSMSSPDNAPRSLSALRAVQSLIKTFSPRDWVGLIAFSGSAVVADLNRHPDDDTGVLVQMTEGVGGSEDNKKKMSEFADKRIGNPMGDTNFYKAFKEGFDMIRNSMLKQLHSNCNTMILFLTDGIDKSGKDILAEIALMQAQPTPLNIPIFTYAFGNEAVSTGATQVAQLPHKIACQNNGIAYDIADYVPGSSTTIDSVADAMTDYYQYFSRALDPTHSSFGQVRWVEWKDDATGNRQLSGCKPVYDERAMENNDVVLTGVVCVDMNMIVDLEELEFERSGYNQLKQAMEISNEQCEIVSYAGAMIKLQELRAAAKGRGYGYVCKSCDFEEEPCPVATPAPTPPAASTADAADVADKESYGFVGAVAVLVLLGAI